MPTPAKDALTDGANKSADEATEHSHHDRPSDSPPKDERRLKLVIPDLEEPRTPTLDDPAPQVPRNFLPDTEPADSSSSDHDPDRPVRVAERLGDFIEL